MEELTFKSDAAKYVYYLLCLDPYLPMSWGAEDYEESDDSLEFHVNGFLHQGRVRITYIEGADLFQVTLYDEEGALTETINGLYLDVLITTLDQKIEKCEDYEQKILEYLNCA